jgi:hypothetical protein
MGEPNYVIFVDCRFCGAERRIEVPKAEGIATAAKAWIDEHRACARGRDAQIDVTGQTDETAPAEPLLSVIVKGEKT